MLMSNDPGVLLGLALAGLGITLLWAFYALRRSKADRDNQFVPATFWPTGAVVPMILFGILHFGLGLKIG